MNPKCRYVEGYGFYLPSHELNCRATDCDGCKPCTHDEHGNPIKHCTARTHCGRHLDATHPLTCPRCIGRTRDDITAILRAVAELPEEATEAGVDSEAANLAGPAADPIRYWWRRCNELRTTGDTELEEDQHHPLAVLGRWELMLREDYEQDYAELPPITIAGAARYLDVMLDVIAQDETQDWPLFASEIRACRSHLEDVLHTARRPETGAPCPSCTRAPALVKRYAHWCEREACEREHDLSGADDAWVCPACKARWSEAEYRLWVADDYLDNAEALTAADLQMTLGIKPGTLRRWANGWTTEGGETRAAVVRKCGFDGSGRQLYDVGDVRDALGTNVGDVA